MNCAAVCAWLLPSDGPTPPSVALAQHLRSCAACAGRLAVLGAAGHLPVPDPATNLGDCAAGLADLPAYLDAVQDDGAATAAHSYPHVWWHLCLCPHCAETAELTIALMDAERRGVLGPPPQLPQLD